MAETHIVEIRVEEEQRMMAVSRHPLAEISQSPGHFLLLKLWQREEELLGRRISRKEWRKEGIRREIFEVCCLLFVFQGLLVTILFTSSSSADMCGKWWIPWVLSGFTSLVMVFVVQLKLCRYWKVDGQLQRDRAEGRALARCIQELRMKGATFDLSKDHRHNNNGKRIKSVHINPLTCCSHYRLSLLFVCFAAFMLPSSRFILCA